MRLSKLSSRTVWCAAALLLAAPLFAAVIWDESVDGDLSNDPAAPTGVSLVDASDAMLGTVGGANPGEFFDVWTFSVRPAR